MEKHLEYLLAETLSTHVDFDLPLKAGEYYELEMGAISISIFAASTN